MTKMVALPVPEWSVLVKSEDVPSHGKTMTISPSDKERAALTERLDILSLDAVEAELKLSREVPHIVHVKGRFQAKVKQACIVTLDPVEAEIVEEFDAWYADEDRAISFKRAQHEAQSKKELVDLPVLEEFEDPEPMTDGMIDIGDLVTQYLSLALPPYPLKPGVERKEEVSEVIPPVKSQMKLNPFAALKDWRPKD